MTCMLRKTSAWYRFLKQNCKLQNRVRINSVDGLYVIKEMIFTVNFMTDVQHNHVDDTNKSKHCYN